MMEFAVVCKFLERMEKNSRSTGKRACNKELIRQLLEAARRCGELYGVMRLLIPKRDGERQHYNLKETTLAMILMHALGISAESKDGVLLSRWKQTENAAAGDFAGVALQIISKRHSQMRSNILLANFNMVLDRLAEARRRDDRVTIVRGFIERSTAVGVKWFLRVVLKDIKVGLGENTILDILHRDARALMASCVDLRLVCEQLFNQNLRHFGKELTVGKVLKSQHSKRMNSIEAAWSAMKGKAVVAECKFDGDRMQVHRDGDNIWFWSRNGKQHPEYKAALKEALCRCLLTERCVLDGELLVWDADEGGFKARTKTLNHDAARAARKGLDTSYRVCYVIFDIIYEEKYGSIMHLPLGKRREILQCVVQPELSPQIFSTATENLEWSILPACMNDVKDFFWRTVEMGNEGIVLKDIGSEWCPDNRDGRWCKIKPDYVFLGSDLDLLIIGGYYGTGSRGGKIASYLLALVDVEAGHINSSRFISVCRCGKGLSEEEASFLESKLSPYLVKNEKGGTPPPTCGYMISNARYECPDVWISKPDKSVVLQVSSEKRIYPSQTFKAGWGFRFPRIVKVRYDKCWNEALQLDEFEHMVKAAKEHGHSILHGPQKYNQLCQSTGHAHRRLTGRKHLTVLSHLNSVDVSNVQQIDRFFEGLIFYICPSGVVLDKENLQMQIRQSGGVTVPNFVHYVTHFIASERKGFQCQVAIDNDRDVICLSWIRECLQEKKTLPLSPRHYLFLSQSTKKKLEEDIDSCGDPWYENVGKQDLIQVLKNTNSKSLLDSDEKSFQEVIKGFGGDWPWSLLGGFCFYFHKPIYSMSRNSQLLAMVALKRLELEAVMLGASVSCSLIENVTHIIVYTPSQANRSIRNLYQSFKPSEREFLQLYHRDIVSHYWLEESCRMKEIMNTEEYILSSENEMFMKASRDSNNLAAPLACLSKSDSIKRISRPSEMELDSDKQRKKPRIRGLVTSHFEEQYDPDLGKFVNNKGMTQHETYSLNRQHCSETMEAASNNTFQLEACCQQRWSEQIWDSQCLQDFAQVYIGCFQSEYSATDKQFQVLSDTQSSQTDGCRSSRNHAQAECKAKGSASPVCLPKRRFTTRDWL